MNSTARTYIVGVIFLNLPQSIFSTTYEIIPSIREGVQKQHADTPVCPYKAPTVLANRCVRPMKTPTAAFLELPPLRSPLFVERGAVFYAQKLSCPS